MKFSVSMHVAMYETYQISNVIHASVMQCSRESGTYAVVAMQGIMLELRMLLLLYILSHAPSYSHHIEAIAAKKKSVCPLSNSVPCSFVAPCMHARDIFLHS